MYGATIRAALAETQIARPRSRAIMPGSTWCRKSMGARMWIACARHHSSGSTCQIGPNGPGTPALLTRRSIGPSTSSTLATACAIEPGSVTSQRTPTAWPPASRIACATTSSSTSERDSSATEAPMPARRSAIARPKPRPAPVTSATCPSRCPIARVPELSCRRASARRCACRGRARGRNSPRIARTPALGVSFGKTGGPSR